MHNLHGNNVITGKQVHKGKDVRVTYALTPVFDHASIPAGRSAHIGQGVFRSVCAGGCGAYVDNYGAAYWIPELRRHEHYDHGLDVVGVNVAMLP